MATASAAEPPSVVLAKALGITAPLGEMAPVLPEHEAMQKLKPLMTSLKQACGYDRSWAPAVHQLLHKILSTVSQHTRPNQKLFCPCCTAQKNRYLFGHYYNTKTLVCKRCSTKFRELVSSGKISPQTNAFHARLVAVMDVNLVGKRKRGGDRSRKGRRRSRETGSESDASSTTAASITSYAHGAGSGGGKDPNPRALKAPRHGSPGPSPALSLSMAAVPAAVGGAAAPAAEDVKAADSSSTGSATSSSTPTDMGLWGDASASDTSDAGGADIDLSALMSAGVVSSAADLPAAPTAADVVNPVFFHDYFDVELNYSLQDMPLFGATPSAGDDEAKAATDAHRTRASHADEADTKTADTKAADTNDFEFALASLPSLSLSDKDGAASPVAERMTREQFGDLVTVYQCALLPGTGDEPIPLDRSMVGLEVPDGEYTLKLSLHSLVPTRCMVTAMVVELPTQLSVSDDIAAPQRVQWTATAPAPTCFKETLHAVDVSGVVEITCAVPFSLSAHRKLAVVAFVTPAEATAFATYQELRRHRVPMLPAGGFFDVVERSEGGSDDAL